MDPVTLLGVVGSAASIYSTLREFWQRGEDITEEDAERIIKDAKSKGDELANDASMANDVSRLDDRVRQVIHDNIEAEIEDVTGQIRGAGPARTRLLGRRLKNSVCGFLETLREANGGTFDGEPWAERHWNDFQCATPNSTST